MKKFFYCVTTLLSVVIIVSGIIIFLSRTIKTSGVQEQQVIKVNTKNRLADTVFTPASVKLKGGKIVTLEVKEGLLCKAGSLPFTRNGILALEDVFAFRLAGDDQWLRMNGERKTTTYVIPKDGELEFKLDFFSLLSGFATYRRSEDGSLNKGDAVITIRVMDSYAGKWNPPKQLEPWQEQLLPDAFIIPKKQRDFDLRDKASRGFDELFGSKELTGTNNDSI